MSCSKHKKCKCPCQRTTDFVSGLPGKILDVVVAVTESPVFWVGVYVVLLLGAVHYGFTEHAKIRGMEIQVQQAKEAKTLAEARKADAEEELKARLAFSECYANAVSLAVNNPDYLKKLVFVQRMLSDFVPTGNDYCDFFGDKAAVTARYYETYDSRGNPRNYWNFVFLKKRDWLNASASQRQRWDDEIASRYAAFLKALAETDHSEIVVAIDVFFSMYPDGI